MKAPILDRIPTADDIRYVPVVGDRFANPAKELFTFEAALEGARLIANKIADKTHETAYSPRVVSGVSGQETEQFTQWKWIVRADGTETLEWDAGGTAGGPVNDIQALIEKHGSGGYRLHAMR
jgi:hypothetical protein